MEFLKHNDLTNIKSFEYVAINDLKTKNIQKSKLLYLLNKHNGIEIYDIIFIRQKKFNILKETLFILAIKYNCNITYDYLLNNPFKNLLKINNLSLLQYLYIHDNIDFNIIKMIYLKLDKLYIKKDDLRIIFNSINDKLNFINEYYELRKNN